MINQSQELENKLGYQFKDSTLLQQALCHRSVGLPSNERLEFLGDSALNFIIAAEIFSQHPECEEGKLSRLRANLVNGKMLAELAVEIGISNHLQLGAGEKKSGGAHRASILADAFEAIVGAIYLDGGIDSCKEVILRLYQSRLADLSISEPKDPKTTLQELMQSKKMPLPQYEIIKTEGAAHAQTFHVQCQVPGLDKKTIGIALSRRQAEQDAAEKFLIEIMDLKF